MKIGILYICIGKYKIFWRDFYLSCEKYFIPEAEKKYFVFTDSDEIDFEKKNSKIHRIFQENLGWPGNTLKRYEIFLRVKNDLLKFDYLFFFNANLLFLQKVTANEFLPIGKEKLVACLHPGYFNKSKKEFAYEKNPKSTAFIHKNQGKYYFAGGINGGEAQSFIKAMEIMNQNIKEDEKNGIVAVWHDESHWNKYLSERSDVKILTPSYLYPEGWSLPFEKKILIRDKKVLGGHNKLRGTFDVKFIINTLKDNIKRLFKFKKIIKIQGGLGNQMFQYAYGRKLELFGKKIIFDISFFKGNKAQEDTVRNFKLDKFNLQTNVEFSDKSHPVLDFWVKIKRWLGLNADIYFQNEKYFIGIADIIRKEFTSKNPLSSKAQEILDSIESNNSISLHIRRGDYVDNKKTNAFHGVCDLDYYAKAMRLIKEKVDSPVFFVFSDDIAWAKDNLKGPEFVFVSGPEIEDVEELMLMSKCKHNIIANSSFSWWGAWLNNNPEKIVIAPQKWFNDKKINKDYTLPEKWIRI